MERRFRDEAKQWWTVEENPEVKIGGLGPVRDVIATGLTFTSDAGEILHGATLDRLVELSDGQLVEALTTTTGSEWSR